MGVTIIGDLWTLLPPCQGDRASLNLFLFVCFFYLQEHFGKPLEVNLKEWLKNNISHQLQILAEFWPP